MSTTTPDGLKYEGVNDPPGWSQRAEAGTTLAEQLQALIITMRAATAAAQAAADAATMQVGLSTRTSNTGGITTTETVLDTVTATLVAGRTYRITYNTNAASTVLTTMARFRIREGNGIAGTMRQLANTVPAIINSDFGVTLVGRFTAVSSGSQTFSGTLVRASGTGTLSSNANTNQPTYMTIERVGA